MDEEKLQVQSKLNSLLDEVTTEEKKIQKAKQRRKAKKQRAKLRKLAKQQGTTVSEIE